MINKRCQNCTKKAGTAFLCVSPLKKMLFNQQENCLPEIFLCITDLVIRDELIRKPQISLEHGWWGASVGKNYCFPDFPTSYGHCLKVDSRFDGGLFHYGSSCVFSISEGLENMPFAKLSLLQAQRANKCSFFSSLWDHIVQLSKSLLGLLVGKQ